MKRKLLIEFANWLATTRHKYDQGAACDCVAGQAARFFGGKYGKRTDAGIDTLEKAFKLNFAQADSIYGGGLSDAKRRTAVEMLRHLVKTGKVDWDRAIARVRQQGFKATASD